MFIFDHPLAVICFNMIYEIASGVLVPIDEALRVQQPLAVGSQRAHCIFIRQCSDYTRTWVPWKLNAYMNT
jgi:hypothetical protein